MGIAGHSGNKAGAMAVCNFLISPEAQLEKMNPQVWGDGTILAIDKLPEAWREKFQHIPMRQFAPKRAEIQSKALPELAPEYMIRLYEDFRKEVFVSIRLLVRVVAGKPVAIPRNSAATLAFCQLAGNGFNIFVRFFPAPEIFGRL